jgi:hypothetical protein
MRTLITLTLLLLAMLAPDLPAAAQTTANNPGLRTWWHAKNELNATTPVADDAVRRSTFYDVKVATAAAPNARFDAFPYMSIPRGGRDKWGYSDDDGAEFADRANLTMSWSSFLYSTDCWVYVTLRNGLTIGSAADVTIRPAALNLSKEVVDSTTIRVRVPYSANGYRFSVEFGNQLYTAYNDMSGTSGRLNDQGIGRAIHTEPRNALLIFAEPMVSAAESARLVPTSASGSIYYPAPGMVNNLDAITQDIVYFRAGVYYMPWNYHAKLPANVKWVYLEPGAFVKGAFQFLHDNQGVYKFTGFGVVSGEKYVYEPDTDNGYQHRIAPDCHGSCVKLLRLQSSPTMQQYLDLQGVTFMEPPYHSFVVYGDENSFQMRVENFKMVGGWYWQTDGLELYSNGTMKNTFFHSNDDVLKVYHSNLAIDNTVVWKNENGPVIQWGWSPRNINNVQVTNTYVIHNKMYWTDVKGNTCIVNSSPSWSSTDPAAAPNAGTTVANLTFENLYVEGKTNCALRLYALSNTDTVHIRNLFIDGWNDLDPASQASKFHRMSTDLWIGNETVSGRGLKLENYRVGGQQIYKAGNNWNSTSTGRLDFDAELWDDWNAW